MFYICQFFTSSQFGSNLDLLTIMSDVSRHENYVLKNVFLFSVTQHPNMPRGGVISNWDLVQSAGKKSKSVRECNNIDIFFLQKNYLWRSKIF